MSEILGFIVILFMAIFSGYFALINYDLWLYGAEPLVVFKIYSICMMLVSVLCLCACGILTKSVIDGFA